MVVADRQSTARDGRAEPTEDVAELLSRFEDVLHAALGQVQAAKMRAISARLYRLGVARLLELDQKQTIAIDIAAGRLTVHPGVEDAVAASGAALTFLLYQPALQAAARLMHQAPETAFSDADKELLFYLRRGWTNAQIGRRVSVAEKTVKNRLTRLYSRLGASRRAEAVIAMERLGVLRDFIPPREV